MSSALRGAWPIEALPRRCAGVSPSMLQGRTLRRSVGSLKEAAGRGQKLAGLLQPGLDILFGHMRNGLVVALEAEVGGRQQPTVELRIEEAGCGELLAERCVDGGVLAERQASLMEERLCHVPHPVIRPPCRELGLVPLEQDLAGTDGVLGLVEELPGGLLHAAMASSRTVTRKGPSPSCHCEADCTTRLMLTSYRSERSETSSAVRSSSPQ